jgi:archaellum biogenesis ATPase FlaH
MQNERPDNHIAISFVLSLTYVLTKTLFKHQHEEIEMKLYGGIDLHSNNSVIAIQDDTGKVLVCKKLPND